MSSFNDELVFPSHLLSSVERRMRHDIEDGEIASDEDIRQLIAMMFDFPERDFYVYLPRDGSLSGSLGEAVNDGRILTPRVDMNFYRHPSFAGDFVKVHKGSETFDWERELTANAPEFMKFTLALSERTRRELTIDQHLAVESERNSNPFKFEPSFWGIGISVPKALKWFRKWAKHKPRR